MSANQGLAYHRISPRFYDLTRLRTGNVRDQMLRAIMLAHGLVHDANEIDDTPDGGLLVLGAGVAGVSCALTAAEKYVSVTLFEKERVAFTTLTEANWRRVAPYEYDWPHVSDPKAQFPWGLGAFGLTAFPLYFESNPASDIADSLQSAFDDWRADHAMGGSDPRDLQFFYGYNLEAFSYQPNQAPNGEIIGVRVTGPWSRGSTQVTSRLFGAVVLCAGCVEERTFDDRDPPSWAFRGHGFWTDEDGLALDDFGVTSDLDVPRRILISGGGDGAMQDLQRAATGYFGAELLERLIPLLKSVDLAPHYFQLMLAEDRGRRAYAWKTEKGLTGQLPDELSAWNRVFADTVNKIIADFQQANSGLLNIPDEDAALEYLASRLLKPILRNSDGPEIVWVMVEPRPAFAYALNRFLSYFVIRLLASVRKEVVLRTCTAIMDIAPATLHANCGVPADCYGRPHTVVLRDLQTDVATPETFEIIILRHGLIFPSNPSLGGSAPVPEQLVPYDLPK